MRGPLQNLGAIVRLRARCWAGGIAGVYITRDRHAHGPDARVSTRLQLAARSAVQIVPHTARLLRLQKFSRGHKFACDQPTQRTRGRAGARPTRILVGGSEALNHVVADTGGRGRAHVDAAKFGAVGNQRPGETAPPPRRRRATLGGTRSTHMPGAGAPARPSRRPTRA